MIKFLALALCVLSACSANARTLYVNASRPNNNGNGLSVKKAKKTIQAAISSARNGDTILVYPGTYASVKTNNKKISIKSVKGSNHTTVKANNSALRNVHALNLGKGNATAVRGFFICQDYAMQYGYGGNVDGAVFGGSVRNCVFSRMGGKYIAVKDGDDYTYKYDHTFFKTKLIDCVLEHCAPGTGGTCMIYGSSLNRCKITGSGTRYGANQGKAVVKKSTLVNCLVTGNVNILEPEWTRMLFRSCTFLNCTVAENADVQLKSSTAINTIFHQNGDHVGGAKDQNRFVRSLVGKDPCFIEDPRIGTEEVERDYWTETVYLFSPGDCRLRKGSPCIDKGKLTNAQKKLAGKKDLAGRKRIRGKAIDLGCYEY